MTSDPAEPACRHILVVDEDAAALRRLAGALQHLPVMLHFAFNGNQGYEQAVALIPDLILLDAGTPQSDVVTVTQRLKDNPITETIPLILIGSLDAGCLEPTLSPLRVLPKPVDLPGLYAELDATLGMPEALSSSATPTRFSGMRRRRSASAQRADLIRSLKMYLSSNLLERPNLKDLAFALNVSERRLVGDFRGALGITVAEYLRQERMRRAQRLLLQTSTSVAGIAEELGFSSAANFTNAFRQHQGVAPSEYRRNATAVESSSIQGSLAWDSRCDAVKR